MATSIITPQQAAAILENGKPFGVGGKTIQVVGFSDKPVSPLYAKTRFIKNPNAEPWNSFDGKTVVDKSTKIDLPTINNLMGGLDWRQLRDSRDRIATYPPEHSCLIEDNSVREPPVSTVTVVTINFNKQKLEEIQQREAGASKK